MTRQSSVASEAVATTDISHAKDGKAEFQVGRYLALDGVSHQKVSLFVQVGRDLVEEEFAETKRVKLSVYVYYAKNVGAVMSALSVLFYLLFQVTS